MQNKVETENPKIAPKGHFVVYVGKEMTRFVIPTLYLKNPLFQQLLDKAAEEFGFDNRNDLTRLASGRTSSSVQINSVEESYEATEKESLQE
ncbi:indole-3-acetic acid-induced ARG7-like [Olea europaea subsp. europaea]|uniref:Indole-3-acetic acid-induced ARG7-like n=1 Tax=Olea europaea subsp. europaea TaxID=158383 RepID=A0A8S0V542_OLEEU|nr:indole-3-acetic acid-induced ARG7-like [Olea europaea subsp. europaea]